MKKTVLKGKIIEQIRSAILGLLPGSEIILFGSRARNDADENSDYDILVISKSLLLQTDRLKYQALIRKKLATENILADIILHSRSDVKIKKKLHGHIVRSALKEGVIV